MMSRDADGNEQTYVESLNLLAANELALESLYREYARQHFGKATFWQTLATDEHGHAQLVAKLTSEVRQDAAKFHLRRLSSLLSTSRTPSSSRDSSSSCPSMTIA